MDATNGNIVVVAGGAITTGNVIMAGGNVSLSTTAGGITLGNGLTTTGGGAVTISSAGAATFTAAGDISADGAVSLTAASGISTAGDVTTTDDDVTYASATNLTGPVVVNTGAGGAGNINFNSTLDGAQNLTLTAGTGNLTFTGTVGATRLGNVTINAATNVTANAFSAATLTQNGGLGTTTFNGAVDTNSAGGISLSGNNLVINSAITTTGTGPVTVAEGGTATLAAAGNISSDGAVSLTATGGIFTAGDVTTTNDSVTYVSATNLTGPVTVNAGSGAITFSNTVNGTQTLTANSTGLTTFNQVVGGTTALTTLTTNAGGTTAINANVTTSGNQAYNDGVRIDGANVTLTSTAGSANFASAIDGLTSGTNNLTINTLAGATTITGPIGGTVPLASLTINTGAAMLLPSTTTTGALTVAAAGAITNTPTAQINIGGLATLNAGSNAITLGTNAGTDTANFGSLTLTGGNVTIAEDSATAVVGTSNAANLSITTAGNTTFSGTTTVTGNLTSTATGTATFSGGTTVGGNLSSTAAGATLLSGTTDVTGNLTVTSTAGTISDAVGSSLTVGGVGTFLAGSLPSSTFDINVGSITSGAANFGSVVFVGDDVTFVETGSSMNVSGTATGHLALTALFGLNMNAPGVNATSLAVQTYGGDITDSGPTVVRPGLSTFDANGFDIILDHPGNDFAQVLLAGQSVTLFDQNAINVVGVSASATLNLSAGGLVSVDIPMNVALSVALTSTGDSVVINAPINIQPQGGTLTINAAHDVTGVVAGTLTTSGGAVSVTAGSNVALAGTINTNGGALSVNASNNVQLAGIATAGGSLTVNAGTATSPGSARFTSPVDVSGIYTVNAGTGGITFDTTVNGSGALAVNTTGTTRFSGAIGDSTANTGPRSITTNVGGTTILAGGSMTLAPGGTGFNFGDAVQLNANTVITAPTGIFRDVVRAQGNGLQSLTLNVSGDLDFRGAVGDNNLRLASLTTNQGGRTIFRGVSVTTTGDQTYNDAVYLGSGTTTITANNLTFNAAIEAATPLPPGSLAGDVIGAAGGLSSLTTNVQTATIFASTIGSLAPIDDIVLNNSTLAATAPNDTISFRGNLNATSLTAYSPVTFEASAATIATSALQDYKSSVTLARDVTFSTSYNGTTATAEGITFRDAITRTGSDRILTVNAPDATILTDGDIGAESARFASVSMNGRNINIGGANMWVTGDIRLGIGTRTGDLTTANDRLSFNRIDPATTARHTRLDSASGEIVLGSGAVSGSAKTGAPARASVFKSGDASDLYLFARKVTIQPFERLAVRDGSLIVIADGVGAEDGISIGSAAASRYLVLASSVPSTAGGVANSIRLQAREASTNLVNAEGTGLISDTGTELIAGKIVFFGAGSQLPNSNIPTRSKFTPDSGTRSSDSTVFNYVDSYTDGDPGNGNLMEGRASDVITVLRPEQSALEVRIADLATSNSSRTAMSGIQYLDLTQANVSPALTQDGFVPASLFGPIVTLPVAGTAQRTVPTFDASPRDNLPTVTTPTVPREELAATPTETDLAAAVREQLQALGIYARGLTEEEKAARRGRIVATFVTVPARVRPVESDYQVVEARVEDRAVREVIQNALDTGLIGEGQTKLEEVAKALGDTYKSFVEANPVGEKSADVLVGEYRDWLLHSQGSEAQTVISYMKALRATLKKIELLGLTKQELEGSKAQIYGSVLRARLNVEPEFLRKLVEGVAEDVWAAKQEPAIPSNKQASNASMAAADGLALY
ncbi:MAG TPA: hypothetical protein VG734_11525 [Lacunisphaera sp.]|nr:hypothetical protein [Lacunisphaera sp.]